MCPRVRVQGGWGAAFADGHAFCAIVHTAEPSAIDLEATSKMAPPQALATAFDAAAGLGVPQLLEPSDFDGGSSADERSVIL